MNASRRLMFACALLAGPALVQANASAPAALLRTGHLQCGPAQLSAATQYLDLPDQPRQVLAQSLSLTHTATGKTIRLAHDSRPLRQPFFSQARVLDAAVTGWACLEGHAAKPYIYVLYTCVESPARPRCVGNLREWARLFDTAGTPLNAHTPRSGQHTPALMKKLGLGRYLSEGVSLQDINE